MHPLIIPNRLSRFQHEIHMHGVIGKDDQAFVGFLQYPNFQKRLNIAVYGLYIPLHTTGGFTNQRATHARDEA